MDAKTPMRPLTKKYIFECKLKGIPLDLTEVESIEHWENICPSLIRLGILKLTRKKTVSHNAKYEILIPVECQDVHARAVGIIGATLVRDRGDYLILGGPP